MASAPHSGPPDCTVLFTRISILKRTPTHSSQVHHSTVSQLCQLCQLCVCLESIWAVRDLLRKQQWVWSLICCRIPVPWKMPLSCQRFSSGGSLGKMVLQNPVIFRLRLTHCSNSLYLFTIICVFCWWLCVWIISALPPQACCEGISHPAGSRGPVDTEGGRHVTEDHHWAAAGLDGWMCQTSKVRTPDNWYLAL